jgi:flavin-dependent dehydrogenase
MAAQYVSAGGRRTGQYSVVIVGGSFAGLSAAMQLRGHRVLLIDQRPIGTHQTSTCATPLSLVKLLGLESSVLERHDALFIHTGGKAIRFLLKEPYVTFDYHAFCQAMLAQTNAEVLLAKATGCSGGTVETSAGSISGQYVIDASGWRSLAPEGPSRSMTALGYGIETELPVQLSLPAGLHFFYEQKIVRSGYGWVFSCGQSVRIGVCSFDRDVRLGPVLDAFLARFGLVRGTTHGGAMPLALRQPLADDLFVVGDAGGQCLPLWAEGIRSAIYHSAFCGQMISAALDGNILPEEARTRYARLVKRKAGFHTLLMHLQEGIAKIPEHVRVPILRSVALPPIADRFIDMYLRSSGWLQEIPLPARPPAIVIAEA